MARRGTIALTANTTTALFTADGFAYAAGATDGAPVKAIRISNLSTSGGNVDIFAAPTMDQAVASGNPFASLAGLVLAPGESTTIWGIVGASGSASLTQLIARTAAIGVSVNFAPVA